MFGGGFNVGINVSANRIIYNDLCTPVVEIIKHFKNTNTENILYQVDSYIAQYGLSKTNSEAFNKFRTDYNKNKTPIALYTLICYSFNYQFRFNKSGDYNMPFGKDRSSFNESLRKKLIDFVKGIKTKNIQISSVSFSEYRNDVFGVNDYVYCDPPYFNSVATYNEQKGWTENNENELRLFLQNLNQRGIKFGLSNNLTVNPTLEEWAINNGFIIHTLNNTYGNCSYHKKDKSKTKDIEVLITNYQANNSEISNT